MPSYRFPSIIAIITAVVIIWCASVPITLTKPWDNNPAVEKITSEKHLNSVPQTSTAADARLERMFDYQLKQYQASLSTLETNLFLQAAFILFGLLVLFGTDEMFELPVIKLKLQRQWLHFIVPAALLFLWLRFGFLLDGLIKTRLYGWELFLRLAPAGGKEYIRSGGALLEDAGFMDGWFALFRRPGEHLIDPKLVDFNKLIFPSVFGSLVAANHAWILGLAYIGYVRLPKKKKRRAALRAILWLSPWFMFLILLVSNVLFYFGGPNPNWFQVLVPTIAVALLFLLIYLCRQQKEAEQTRLLRESK
jgi:hypothetical protein